MSNDIKKAIESLKEELKKVELKSIELKKMINNLSVFAGEHAPFSNIETTTNLGSSLNILPDQFFGKGLSTAVKEYLRMKGRAATVDEIYEALNSGGFEYPKEWKDKTRKRNLAISLSKNRYDFCYVKTDTISAFGLWDFYPDKKREREKAKNIKDDLDGLEEVPEKDNPLKEEMEDNK
jgi:hypothetical protein